LTRQRSKNEHPEGALIVRLLFISNLYPPHHLGGYEQLCQEVATLLTARGHQITVLTSTFQVPGRQTGEEPAVRRTLKLASDVYYYKPQQLLGYQGDANANLQAVRDTIAETKPDAVVIWGMWNLSPLVAAEAERCAGSNVAYYFANEWPIEPSAHEAYWEANEGGSAGRLFKSIARAPVRNALNGEWRPYKLRYEHPITCSLAVRDHLVKAGVPIQHAEVIYHGIDPTPYRQAVAARVRNESDETMKVVFVGSLLPQKGVHTAVEAMGRLAQDRFDAPVSLDILGAGHPDYGQHLRQLVQDWHIQDRVTFHTPIERAKLPAFLAQYDVLVMPSIWEEPQARISQEAMAAGLVLVGTLTGGSKEILVDGQNGLAFKPEDAQGLADQLKILAKDPALRPRLTEAGWQTVSERFTISRMLDHLEAYLTEVAMQQRVAA
jgi:glycogen(starch) synthase